MGQSKLIDSLLVFSVMILVSLTIPAAMMMSGPAMAGRPALVVSPPWGMAPATIIARAGGREIGLNAAPFGRLAVFDAPEKAYDAGAWMVLDAEALASLCGVSGV